MRGPQQFESNHIVGRIGTTFLYCFEGGRKLSRALEEYDYDGIEESFLFAVRLQYTDFSFEVPHELEDPWPTDFIGELHDLGAVNPMVIDSSYALKNSGFLAYWAAAWLFNPYESAEVGIMPTRSREMLSGAAKKFYKKLDGHDWGWRLHHFQIPEGHDAYTNRDESLERVYYTTVEPPGLYRAMSNHPSNYEASTLLQEQADAILTHKMGELYPG